MYCQIMEYITIFANFTKFKSFIFKNLENDTRPVVQVSDVAHRPLVLKITNIES